jgi:hypothetical protein
MSIFDKVKTSKEFLYLKELATSLTSIRKLVINSTIFQMNALELALSMIPELTSVKEIVVGN